MKRIKYSFEKSMSAKINLGNGLPLFICKAKTKQGLSAKAEAKA